MFFTQVSGEIFLLAAFIPVFDDFFILLYHHITLREENTHLLLGHIISPIYLNINANMCMCCFKCLYKLIHLIYTIYKETKVFFFCFFFYNVCRGENNSIPVWNSIIIYVYTHTHPYGSKQYWSLVLCCIMTLLCCMLYCMLGQKTIQHIYVVVYNSI